MSLFKWELKKLFKNKVIVFTALIVLVITNGVLISDTIELKNRVKNLDKYNEMIKNYEGKINIDFVPKVYERKDTFSDGNLPSNLKDDERRQYIIENEYCLAIDSVKEWLNSKGEIQEYSEYPFSVTGLSNFCNRLVKEGKKDSYTYKSALKHLDMMKKAGEPKFYNSNGWSQLYGFLLETPSIIFTAIVLIMAIAPIFSNERRNGMERVILSTKNGRNKIVESKIKASLVFVVFWVTIFYLTTFMVSVLPTKNFSNGKIPLNALYQYELTPYNFTVFKTLYISYLTTVLSACTLGVVFCLISSISKNNIGSIAFSFIFVIAPLFIRDKGTIAKILALFPSLTISGGMLFRNYHDYNILGKPMSYPIVGMGVSIIIFTVVLILNFKVYNKKIKA